ncbi:response regulator transcription factor [Paenibacillus xerothermodurans]|uniref:Response regulator n=1 Tax=Paenibacillus xerothermodurans TaxID=1977292 RepID=A0A2W1NQK7_PAEXE|nr:response regulator [Paenibacillus xerothermodurans]PZE21143.1 response regulator [Paenibacillus xerothermodurans]
MYRILIVDDEPHIREGITAKIDQCGNTSLTVSGAASNGSDALKWLQAHYADICITDIRMPVMDGIGLIRSIRVHYPWMQCFIVSSYDDFQYASQAIQLGVTDYILKPVEREVIKQSLHQASDRIAKSRADTAFKILVQKMHAARGLAGRWQDLLLTHQFDKYPLLVADTLSMMDEWVGGQYYLFDSLCKAWIQMVAEGVKLGELQWPPIRDEELGFESRQLPLAHARFYFRLCAVMRLEKGILHLMERLQNDDSKENSRIVQQIKGYIDRHYAEKINLEELADLIPISKSYLAVLFKQSTGQTIWNYLVDVRMKHAKLLLLDQQLKVYEIANKIGYENSEHFSKLFKGYFGITPKEYRRAMDLRPE